MPFPFVNPDITGDEHEEISLVYSITYILLLSRY